jgi:AI-2 transport protein TqsA
MVIVGYALINFAQDQFLQPVVMGSQLNLSPLVVFITLVVWAWILGAAGALLAVPLTLGLVTVLEAFPYSRSLASLFRNKIEPNARTDP